MSAFTGRVDVAGSRGTEPEPLEGEAPDDYVVRCAVAKLGAGPFDSDAACLVSADTVVALDGEILGKPKSDGHARSMLKRLRNRRHQVVTGVAILDLTAGRTVTGSESSSVLTRDYSTKRSRSTSRDVSRWTRREATRFRMATLPPSRNVEGCYLNVVGLPLCLLLGLLRSVGVETKLRPLNEVPYYDRCTECRLGTDPEAAP